MSYFDNSPNLVDDLTPKAETEAAVAMLGGGEDKPSNNPNQTPTSAPASAPASAPQAGQPTETRSPLAADALIGSERSPFAADVSPYGSHVAINVQRAAESKGRPNDEAIAIGKEWAQSFAHFGVPESHVAHLVGAGLQVADAPPTAEVEAAWQAEAKERLAMDFGGPEAGARALETARAWVQKHPQLASFLQRTRLGNHPRVVSAIAETASMARKAGKF